jgi:hypothetical protein
MFNFNAVSENIFEATLIDHPHSRSEHGYIDGGYIFRDSDDRILGMEIPTVNADFEYFVAADIAATVH